LSNFRTDVKVFSIMAIIFHDDYQKSLEIYFNYGYRTRLFHRLRIEQIISLMKKYQIRDMSILDVGCSSGALSMRAASFNKQITGIDPEDKGIVKFKQWRRQKNILNTKIDKGVTENLPYKENSFEAIICSEVLEHVQDIKKSVDEMYRVLKPKGFLFLSMPNKFGFDWWFLMIRHYRETGKRSTDPHTFFYPAKTRTFFTQFNILEEKGNGIIIFPWRFLARIPRHKPISFLYYHLDRLLGKTPLKFFGTNYFFVLQKTSGGN